MSKLEPFTQEIEQNVCNLALLIKNDPNFDYIQSNSKNFFKAALGQQQFQYFTGASKSTIALPNYVIKFSRWSDTKDIQKELKGYKRYIGTWAQKYVTETHKVTCLGIPFLIQERVQLIPLKLYKNKYMKLREWSKHLGYDDLHDENIGWKEENGKKYPVLFDLEHSTGPKEEYIWR